jgi:ribulose-phosphate 3-epimerase
MREPAIVASVLGADYARLGREVAELETAGVDRVQWDIMDGRFVPNLSFGADVVAACRGHTTVPYEAHLMVEDPDPWLQPFADAGCDTALVQVDVLLVMTVNPGFGGQAYLETMAGKGAEARRLIEGTGLPISIEVDGDISAATAPGAVRAGAELLVAGSAILTHPEGRAAAVAQLRRAITTTTTTGIHSKREEAG